MKEYVATRNEFGVTTVKVYGDPTLKRPWHLRKRLDLRHYCPDPFEWGYTGPASAQLSLALLADYYDHQGDEQAIDFHEDFLTNVVARLPHEGWTMTTEQIERALLEETVVREEERKKDPPNH